MAAPGGNEDQGNRGGVHTENDAIKKLGTGFFGHFLEPGINDRFGTNGLRSCKRQNKEAKSRLLDHIKDFKH